MPVDPLPEPEPPVPEPELPEPEPEPEDPVPLDPEDPVPLDPVPEELQADSRQTPMLMPPPPFPVLVPVEPIQLFRRHTPTPALGPEST